MTTWKPTVCIYHGGCADGFGAAWAVWKRWGDGVTYIPGRYGEPLPNLDYQDVLMVDFSVKRDAMTELGRSAVKSVVVLDHHKTAEAELAPWRIGRNVGNVDLTKRLACIGDDLAQNRMENVLPIIAFFDMQKSGARMAWEFCHPQSNIPQLLAHIEDRDLWRFWMPDTRAVHAAIMSQPFDFARWDWFASRMPEVIADGQAIERHRDTVMEQVLRAAYLGNMAGHDGVVLLNAPYMFASDAASMLLERNPAAPFAAVWSRTADGKTVYSLRSTDDRADVSEIARRFGGGGHRNAAGMAIAAMEIAP